MDTSPPNLSDKTAKSYKLALETINAAKVPILIGGGIAFYRHTGYPRDFNDLDIFCKASDYPKILKPLAEKGFKTAVQDEKWIAKAAKDKAGIDIIFSTPNNIQPVDDSWFAGGEPGKLFDTDVTFLGVNELLWSKLYVQNATKFDGPDVYHLILKNGDKIDWKHILQRMETDWEVLLAAIINYRFVFPSKRNLIPEWLMTELIERLQRQREMPPPKDNVSRGPLLSRTNYSYDIGEGGFIV